MNLYINDKEIINFLYESLVKDKKFYDIPPLDFFVTNLYKDHFIKVLKENKNNLKWNKEKELKKIEKSINDHVKKELKNWKHNVEVIISARKIKYQKLFQYHFETIIDTIGEDKLFEIYKKSKVKNFIKSVGLQLDAEARFVRRKNAVNDSEICLLRNTVHNEELLVTKIKNNHQFWFIDSGYTNFIESNKKWHRLIENHLHYNANFIAPANRLCNLNKFPQKWRLSGDRILVIEPGQFSAAIFNVDIDKWKYQVEDELRKYTNKKIVFREKITKKKRMPLYQHLLDEDYYCIVNINSNAATESIWAGIPVITLDKHITNPITRSKLSDINDLYRGDIGNWLCFLTYCQFTYDELVSGQALKIIKEYHV